MEVNFNVVAAESSQHVENNLMIDLFPMFHQNGYNSITSQRKLILVLNSGIKGSGWYALLQGMASL